MNCFKILPILLVVLTSACSSMGFSNNPSSSNKDNSQLAEDEVVFWVNSLRVDCVGVAARSCLQIQKGRLQKNDELKQDAWQLFYSPIEGFNFEAGYIYKLLLKKERLALESVSIGQVPADASSVNYSLVKVLDKKADARLRLNDIWALASLQSEELVLGAGIQRPQVEIHLRDMKLIGSDGCNDLFATIDYLDSDTISFGPIAATRKFCPQMDIPERFNQQLNKVAAYKLEGLRLRLFDSAGAELLEFNKID